MYKTCPKCGYQQQPGDTDRLERCPDCGLVYRKWLKSQLAPHVKLESAVVDRQTHQWGQSLRDFIFPVRPGISRTEFVFYVCVFVIFLLWGFHFVALDYHTNEIGRSFLHNVNLVFHEAGHFFFQPFGRFTMLLGGSLFQVAVPLLLTGAFLLINREGFSASICLWWTGQSFMDLAPYIADARALRLPLLGGGTGADVPGMHDWANILRQLGWLTYDQQIAGAVNLIGSGVIILSLLWGVIMLKIYYRNIKP